MLAGAAQAAEIKDGTWLFSLGTGAGLVAGSAKSKSGPVFLATAGALYAPRGEGSWGLSADKLLCHSKKGTRLDATALTFTGRAYFANDNAEVLPYALFGVGWSESHADLPDGTSDRGSGPALALGAGFHRMKDSPLSWGVEARLLRVAAGLPRAGLGGLTVLNVTASLLFRTASTEYFSR